MAWLKPEEAINFLKDNFQMNNKINAAVLGCTGYTGLELLNILYKHSKVTIKFIGSNSHAGKKINSLDKRLKYSYLPKIAKINKVDLNNIDVTFLALPHSISQNIIKKNFGKTIFIDLSADFRIKNPKVYEKNYNLKHKCPSLINKFAYGLPEIFFEEIKNKKNTAVPGCYPTSVLLPLLPLVKKNLIKSDNIVIDSKSGYSGAGKNFKLEKLFKKDQMNLYNYNTNSHRHICEIDQILNMFSKKSVNFSFNPHILPIFRGMMSTIYCDLQKNINKKDIYKIYKSEYSKNHYVRILRDNEDADFFNVSNTNNCLIKLYNHYSSRKIIIVSLIDNLIKGASGQAIQCMNLVFNFNQNEGLN